MSTNRGPEAPLASTISGSADSPFQGSPDHVVDDSLDVLQANFIRHNGAVPENSNLVAQRKGVLEVMAGYRRSQSRSRVGV